MKLKGTGKVIVQLSAMGVQVTMKKEKTLAEAKDEVRRSAPPPPCRRRRTAAATPPPAAPAKTRQTRA